MKKASIILSLLAASIALLLSVLPLSNLAYIPAIGALTFGVLALMVQRGKSGKKAINLAFLLTTIALCFTVYKSIFSTTEIGDIDEFQEKTEKSVEESLETLEGIDIIDEEPEENDMLDNSPSPDSLKVKLPEAISDENITDDNASPEDF